MMEPEVLVRTLTPKEVASRKQTIERLSELISRESGDTPMSLRRLKQYKAHVEHERQVLNDGGFLLDNVKYHHRIQ